MKYDIFISYRREDGFGRSNVPTARQFKQAFEGPLYHYKVFFDYSECTDNYFSDIILPAIRTCDFFVLVLTKDCLLRCFNEGDWVRREIEEAITYGRKIIPITPDKECDTWPNLPSSLSKLEGLQITTVYTDHMFELGVDFLVKNRFHFETEDERKAREDMERKKSDALRQRTSLCPEGAINGVFSVSPTKKVFFSKGNLQYQASNDRWRFAENQYDMIGRENGKIAYHNNDWIDLFGWGTGDNPIKDGWDISFKNFVDWGKNRISNGGNNTSFWTTLSEDEWKYVFNERRTDSGIRFARAQVNGVDGIILFPDCWLGDSFKLVETNHGDASFDSNIIDKSTWEGVLQKKGVVYLPAAGHRAGKYIYRVGASGKYWSSTNYDRTSAYLLRFGRWKGLRFEYDCHSYGFSVRLVRVVE